MRHEAVDVVVVYIVVSHRAMRPYLEALLLFAAITSRARLHESCDCDSFHPAPSSSRAASISAAAMCAIHSGSLVEHVEQHHRAARVH